jgi:hypothetical protein
MRLHLGFDPERESNLLQLPNDHVGASPANQPRNHAGQKYALPELVAVFASRQVLKDREVLEKITPHELLSDCRSALREVRWTIPLVSPAQPDKARQQRSNPDFAQHARNSGVVNSAM